MTQKELAKEFGITQSYLSILLKTNSLEVLRERYTKGLSLSSGNNQHTRHEKKVKANIISYPPHMTTQLPRNIGDVTVISKVYYCFNQKTKQEVYLTQEELDTLEAPLLNNHNNNHNNNNNNNQNLG